MDSAQRNHVERTFGAWCGMPAGGAVGNTSGRCGATMLALSDPVWRQCNERRVRSETPARAGVELALPL